MLQIFSDTKTKLIERKLSTFKLTIDSGCEILGVLEQLIIHNAEELDWHSRFRQARLNHMKAVGYLRLEGYPEVADFYVDWYDYIDKKGRDYLRGRGVLTMSQHLGFNAPS